MLERPRRLALALAMVLPLPSMVSAQGFEYAPSTGQYRITSASKISQEAMGQRQEFESSSNQLISITVTRPVKDTLNMVVVLDSISATGPMGPPPGIEKLPGTRVTTKLAPFGLVYSASGPDSTVPNAAQLTEEMSRILPRIRKPLAPGASWTDTTSIKSKQNGMDMERRIIATYTVVGDTTVGADKSWKLGRESVTALSGSGAPQGQPMTLEGTSKGKGTVLVSQKNVFVGMQSEEQIDIKIVLAANGMEIGMLQTVNTKVEKVK